MKNHAERAPMPFAKATDTVTQFDLVVSTHAFYRAAVDREDHSVSLAERHDGGPRLHARALLGLSSPSATKLDN